MTKRQNLEVNPLTGAVGPSCKVFDIVDEREAPRFKRQELFDAVFGPMEKLRIEETKHCLEQNEDKFMFYRRMRRGQSQIVKQKKDTRSLSPHVSRHHPIGDLAFNTLIMYWHDSAHTFNWVFPIDVTPFTGWAVR
jgi:hypothetical protein